ncbi:MAG: PAS domain-containing protein, partial [Methylovirgula sp.]
AKADLEILLLPLRHNGYAQARILGLMTAAARPTWLGLLPVDQFTLRSLRAIDDGELPAPPLPEPLKAKMHGHLRVFPGGK